MWDAKWIHAVLLIYATLRTPSTPKTLSLSLSYNTHTHTQTRKHTHACMHICTCTHTHTIIILVFVPWENANLSRHCYLVNFWLSVNFINYNIIYLHLTQQQMWAMLSVSGICRFSASQAPHAPHLTSSSVLPGVSLVGLGIIALSILGLLRIVQFVHEFTKVAGIQKVWQKF